MNFKPLDTNSFANSRFSAHGRVRVDLRDNVIIYDVAGPFNLELIKAFAKTLGQLLKDWRPNGPFASLTFWHESLMATPDALAAYREVLRRNRDFYPKEVINVWCVPPTIEGRLIMEPVWLALYTEAGYPLEIVHDADVASERLRWHLDQASGGANQG